MIGAPDFRDPERERTFYVADGNLLNMTGEIPVAPGKSVEFYGPGSQTSLPAPDVGFMAVASADGQYTLAQWWEGATTVSGNAQESIQCMHVNPTFGDIPADGTVTRHGRLYMMHGTPEQALARYRQDPLAGGPDEVSS